MRWRHVFAAGALLVALAPHGARAGGLLIGDDDGVVGPERLAAEVEIRGQVATTQVELAFRSAGGRLRFAFPVPEAANVVGFAVHDGGAWREGTLSREDAPTVDDLGGGDGGGPSPAVRAYLGANAFVAPLPPTARGELRVRLTYIEILPYAFGEVTLRHPLPSAAVLVDPALAELDVHVRLETYRRLKGYQAPGFVELERVESRDDRRLDVRYAARDFTPSGDFTLRWAVEQGELFTHLLTDHEDCEEDGFFLLVVEPRHDVRDAEIVPKYFTFVVDTSGSMSGYKMNQAIEAAEFAVTHLNPEDRFNVVTFSSSVSALFREPVTADEANRRRAAEAIRELWASGGTNIHDALMTAFASDYDRDFARIVVLLTDGQPTAGVTDPDAIVDAVTAANGSDARLFTFGVGQDVNERLLRALAAANRGEAQLLAADADIAGLLTDFFRRVDRPVLTDVSLDFGGADVHEVYPDEVTDLFAGTQLLVLGRYRGAGRASGRLEGSLRGEAQSYEVPLDFPACALDANPFLPRLWAKAKIDALIARMALAGEEDPETVAEIEALATRYGIQTRYTSYGIEPGVGDPAGPPGGATPYGGGYDRDPGGYASGGLEDEARTFGCSVPAGGAPALGPLALLLVLGRLRRRR